jgi:hypothetical protein
MHGIFRAIGDELKSRLTQKNAASASEFVGFQSDGAVHIFDYKPDARTNRPIAHLTIDALALSNGVPGLRLFDIKCAWLNEEEYCEFSPRTLF